MDQEKDSIRQLFSQTTRISRAKKDVILQPGSDNSHIYLLEEGYVRLYGIVDEDREVTLHIFKPGSYFPMFLVMGNEPNTYFFEAMTNVYLRKLPGKLVTDFLEENPEVLRQFNKRVVSGLSGLLMNVQNFLFGSIHHRVLAVLRMLARRFGEKKVPGQIFITIPLTHEDISHMIGATREATSVELLKLSQDRMISYGQQHITIHMMEKIEHELLSDQPAGTEEHGL